MSEFEEERPDGGGEGESPPDTPAPAPAPALREDQLQNAVAFLSHPKVRSSTSSSKREFLQRKGLTEAEIDEAFRRVPETPAGAGSGAASPGVPTAASAPSTVHSTLQHLQPQAQLAPGQHQQAQYVQQHPGYGPGAMVMAPAQPAPPPPQQGIRWTQAVLGAGFLAASAYAAKSLMWPYVEGAYYSWRGHVRPPPRPLLTNGDASQGAQATHAVADAIAAQTAELRSSIDSIKQLVAAMEAQRAEQASSVTAGVGGDAPAGGGLAAGAGDGLTVADLRQELRSFAETLQELASPGPAAAGAPTPAGAAGSSKLESELGEIKSLLAELLRSPRSSGSHSPPLALPGSKAAAAEAATPQSVASALPLHRTSSPGAAASTSTTPVAGLAGGMGQNAFGQAAAAADGGTPSLPLPGQQQQQDAAQRGLLRHAQGQEQDGQEDEGQHATPLPLQQAHSQQAAQQPSASAASDGGPPVPPPHPASYMEVLEMLEKGQTPPGIRTDINDKPPNPHAAPAAPKLKPRPKPWERSGAGSSLAGSLAGGAGGSSSSSLASLGVGTAGGYAAGPSAAAAPASVLGAAGMAGAPPAVAGASPAAAAAAAPLQPAGLEGAAGAGAGAGPAQLGQHALSPAQLGQHALSPVRAPSPAEEFPGAAPGAVGTVESQQQQQEEDEEERQAPLQVQDPAAAAAAAVAAAAAAGSAAAARPTSRIPSPPRRAASIYEAVAPAPDSPHIIAGRLSPGRPDVPLGRSGSSSSLGAGGGVRGSGAQPSSSIQGGGGGGSGSTFASLLAAAQERADAADMLRASSEGPPVPAPLEGSGIGRPISRNWRPPPIPAPTLSGSSSGLPPAPSSAAVDAASGSGNLPAGGMAAGVRAASAASLGEDFASA